MSKQKFNTIVSATKKEAAAFKIKKVLVALSGGADSIATSLILKNAGLEIVALHCNFHLRAAESNRDMEFVRAFCKNIDIPLEIVEFNVENYISKNKGISIEMACRNLRHDWFKEKLSEYKFDRIATGHNADDNIETFFLNLLRGSGSRGLKGMTIDNGIIWRPLLKFHRDQILNFLKENNQEFVVDSTNLENDFRRNILRNKILPLMKEEWKGFNASLDKTIQNIDAENKIVETELNRILKPSKGMLKVSDILNFSAPLLLIRRFIDTLEPFSTTPSEIISAIKSNKPHIRRWRLKKGIVILRNGILYAETYSNFPINHSDLIKLSK